MLVEKKVHDVEIGGFAGEAQQFSIAVNSKMFELLSSSLYSDKIGSIIRELSCNAVDSHVEKGISDPIEITLPNTFNKEFIVRDFGVGISEEDIYDIFTCYGASTKSESNDYIGAFGLGSKTPFSYTSAFTIVSTQNYKSKNYAAFIAEDGFPTIIKNQEYDVEFESGFEVKFPVKAEDETEFRKKTQSAFQYFKFPVSINGELYKAENYFQKKDVIFEEKNVFRIYHKAYNKSGVLAIVGNVAYPIVLAELRENNHISDEVYKFFNHLNVEIDFNIGDLDLSVSRENLAYTKKTVQNIKKKLNIIYKHVYNFVQNEVKEIPTIWDKALKSMEIQRKFGIYISFDEDFHKINEGEFDLLRIVFMKAGAPYGWNKKFYDNGRFGISNHNFYGINIKKAKTKGKVVPGWFQFTPVNGHTGILVNESMTLAPLVQVNELVTKKQLHSISFKSPIQQFIFITGKNGLKKDEFPAAKKQLYALLEKLGVKNKKDYSSFVHFLKESEIIKAKEKKAIDTSTFKVMKYRPGIVAEWERTPLVQFEGKTNVVIYIKGKEPIGYMADYIKTNMKVLHSWAMDNGVNIIGINTKQAKDLEEHSFIKKSIPATVGIFKAINYVAKNKRTVYINSQIKETIMKILDQYSSKTRYFTIMDVARVLSNINHPDFKDIKNLFGDFTPSAYGYGGKVFNYLDEKMCLIDMNTIDKKIEQGNYVFKKYPLLKYFVDMRESSDIVYKEIEDYIILVNESKKEN